MSELELKSLLHTNGWYLGMIQRYKTRYAYAKRRVGKKVQSRYLGTENKFDRLTSDQILKRLQS
jgi:hypothetical protein